MERRAFLGYVALSVRVFPASGVIFKKHEIFRKTRIEWQGSAGMVHVAAINIHLRDGDLQTAELHVRQLAENADKHSLASYQAVARAMTGELLARRGQPDRGIDQLRRAVAALRELRYEWMTVSLLTAIANGLAAGSTKR